MHILVFDSEKKWEIIKHLISKLDYLSQYNSLVQVELYMHGRQKFCWYIRKQTDAIKKANELPNQVTSNARTFNSLADIFTRFQT
jgi:hypothetical protein